MLDAFYARDVDAYLAHLTDDIVLCPPGFIFGQREQRGHEDVRAAFAELDETLGPDRKFEFRNVRYFLDRADESKVLVVSEITVSPRFAETFGSEAALLLTMRGDKVARIDSWRNEAEGLAQLQDPVAVAD
jgi:hypothetical protein